MILISKSSSGNNVSSFLSNFNILMQTIALMWCEISSIRLALRSSSWTFGKFLQKSPSMTCILLLDKFSLTMLSNLFELSIFLLKMLLKLMIFSFIISGYPCASPGDCCIFLAYKLRTPSWVIVSKIILNIFLSFSSALCVDSCHLPCSWSLIPGSIYLLLFWASCIRWLPMFWYWFRGPA